MIFPLYDYRLEGQVHSDVCSVRILTFFNSSKCFITENWLLPRLDKPINPKILSLIYTVKLG